MYKKYSYLIATFFGSGLSPFAPGTFGSLATLPLAFVLAYFYGLPGILFGTLISFALGYYATKEVLKYTSHDPSFIVIDETAGQLLSFASIANILVGNCNAWLWYSLGFGFFRFFDILKPQPVRWADKKLESAMGVMLDDILAGIYASICLYVIYLFVR